MIISLSYYIGDSSKQRYFDTFKDMEEFIIKSLEVIDSDYQHFDLSVSTGDEEKRVRKIIEGSEKNTEAKNG